MEAQDLRMLLGHRIRQARVAAGLSLRGLASQVGVSHQAIAKYERGKDTPGSAVLLRLSEALGVPWEYFVRPRRLEIAEVHYRALARLPKREREKLLMRATEWLERYLEVEELYPAELTAPASWPDIRAASPEEAETAAERLRREWNLGLDPIASIMEVLEERGFKVGVFSGFGGFDGACFLVQEGSPAIIVSGDVPGDRQRFSLAHELAHLVLRLGDSPGEEKIAHRFAGAFLVPAQVAERELGGRRRTLGLYELLILKHRYGLSMNAWIRRAQELGIISPHSAEGLRRMFRKRGWHITEPGKPLPPEKPFRLQKLVLRALAEGLVSERRAAELLGEPWHEFCRRLAGEHGDAFAKDFRS